MKLLQVLAFAASASAAVIVFPRDRISGCKDDNCMRGVNKLGEGVGRMEDCSSFVNNHKITSYVYKTVSKTDTLSVPTIVTTVITKHVTVESASTTVITQTSTITLPALVPRDDELLGIERRQDPELPFGIPSWASNCKSKDGTEAAFRFSSACSCFFRTALKPPVTMQTVITTISLTETSQTTKVLTQTAKITTSVPVTTVVNVETQTDEKLVTVTATPSPVVQYYVRVNGGTGLAGVANATYKHQYITRDSRPFENVTFTLSPNLEDAIKFEWEILLLDGPTAETMGGHLWYELDGQRSLVSTEVLWNLPEGQERFNLISVYRPLLEGVFWVGDADGDGVIHVASEVYPDWRVVYHDNDEAKYGDRAGRLGVGHIEESTLAPGEGITYLSLFLEKVLPEVEED